MDILAGGHAEIETVLLKITIADDAPCKPRRWFYRLTQQNILAEEPIIIFGNERQ